MPELRVAAVGHFLALVPSERSPEIDRLAAEVVETVSVVRAPLTAAERERRGPSRLTDRQLRYLDRWGYPYVLDEFRFHMTLTGPLPEAEIGPLGRHLATCYRERPPGLRLDALTIFRQPSPAGRFRVLARLPFGTDQARES